MYKINPCVADIELDQQNVCKLCNKKVLNLSKYSDEEVDELIKTTPEGICGSAPLSRMNTAYYLHPFRRFALAILVVFGSSVFILDAKAQDTIQKIQNEVLVKSHENFVNETIIEGYVMDKESKEHIPFAAVYTEIHGVKIGSYTNFEGKYLIQISNNELDSIQIIDLNISFIGYSNQEPTTVNVNKGKTNIVETIYITESKMLEGMVIYGGIHNPIIDKEPDLLRQTTFKRKDIEKMPRND